LITFKCITSFTERQLDTSSVCAFNCCEGKSEASVKKKLCVNSIRIVKQD
jgi:hypothetical protein